MYLLIWSRFGWTIQKNGVIVGGAVASMDLDDLLYFIYR